MNQEVRNRFLFVVLLGLIVIWFSLPMSTFEKVFGAESAVTQKMQSYKISLGLDLVGGTELDYKIDLSEAHILNTDDDPQNDVNIDWIAESVRDALEARVNPAGVGEIIVKRSKVDQDEHVLIQMPPSSNVAQAKQDAEKDNRLEFYEEDPEKEKSERVRIEGIADGMNPENFTSKAQEIAKIDPEAQYLSYDPKFKDAFSDQALADKVFAAPAGSLLPDLIDLTSEAKIEIDEDGKGAITGGFEPLLAIVRVTEKVTETRSKTTPPQAQARHILISAKENTRANEEKAFETKEEAKAEAEAILQAIKDGGDFDALAREKSMGPTATEGGNLGTFEPGRMVEAFDQAIFGEADEEGNFNFEPKENYLIPEVIETDFGYHVIEVVKSDVEKTEDVEEEKVGYELLGWNRTNLRWVKTALDGSHLEAAAPAYDQQVGTPIVSLRFTPEGGDLFAEITERIAARKCDGEACLLGSRVGGVWVSRATVREKIVGRDAIISGQFNFEQVKRLASDLNLGAIAAPVKLSGQTTIKAELGAAQLSQSVKAAGFGLLATIIFMIAMYRFAGVIAAIALLLYCGMFLTILKVWPESFGGPIVLSLSGVAGMALSIGLAVDGNILIFERMKEELSRGQSIGKAVDLGFARAWHAIRDSNLTTLLTCIILFIMGSSIVRGFSIMLIVGTLLSMFSAIIISRNLLRFFLQFKALRNPALYAMTKGASKPKKSKKK
ncbi:MAG TPA: protein translocase subunit SecD [Candidatus Gracilibacteria bacterium]